MSYSILAWSLPIDTPVPETTEMPTDDDDDDDDDEEDEEKDDKDSEDDDDDQESPMDFYQTLQQHPHAIRAAQEAVQETAQDAAQKAAPEAAQAFLDAEDSDAEPLNLSALLAEVEKAGGTPEVLDAIVEASEGASCSV